jgi:hypothetical protein
MHPCSRALRQSTSGAKPRRPRPFADASLFSIAQAEHRTIVTENVADFRVLASNDLQQGRSYAGFIITTNRRFPRHDRRTTGRLVEALDRLLYRDSIATNVEHWLT